MFLIRTLALSAIALALCGCTFPLSPLMIIMLADEPAQTQKSDDCKGAQPNKSQMGKSLPDAKCVAKPHKKIKRTSA
ncbi:MAG: hypothetical protein IKS15_02785 [Opitutales bacterium]|nr:hypothetical protein [Opitutales bacterium]